MSILYIAILREAYRLRYAFAHIAGVFVKEIPLTLMWMCLIVFVMPPFFVVRLSARVLAGIHSARRVTTGLSTLAAGTLYLIFVPFGSGLPMAAAAIGCGLVTGAFSTAVMALFDRINARNQLMEFWETGLFDYVRPRALTWSMS